MMMNATVSVRDDFLQSHFEPLSVSATFKAGDDKDLEKISEDTAAEKNESNTLKINSNKRKFKEWLKVKYLNESIALKYLNLIDTINKNLKDEKIVDEDLFLITEPKNLKKIQALLMDRGLLEKLKILKAFDNLIDFLQDRLARGKNSVSIVVRKNQTEKKFSVFKGNAILSETTVGKILVSTAKSETQMENKKLSQNEKYAEILSKYFGEDGYRLGRKIQRNKFRNYFFNEYGENPEDPAEQIEEILKKIGTQRDDRIFPRQDDETQNQLIYDIVNDVIAAFELGASAVFVEAVYNKYQKSLADNLKIYNENSCAAIVLQNANGKIFQYDSLYFSPSLEVQKATPSNDVLLFMQKFHQPLSYSRIATELWYIPRDELRRLLNKIPEIAYVGNEKFFYVLNLPVNEIELQKISSLIQMEIDIHGYVTNINLMYLIKSKLPIIAMNLEGFSASAVKNCLRYILRDRFDFNGSIISALGSRLNINDVYIEFVRNREDLTIDELKNFSKEILDDVYYGKNALFAHWNVIFDEMVRISQNKFVSKNLIEFDVSRIDDFLDEMYPQSYTPFKEITLFINFPNIGYVWNSYVLESYLHIFSRKFRLVHSDFSAIDVYGAMVRVDSAISDYESLITDALSYSDALTESKALQFIVDQGYQQRKVYKNIGAIIRNAKILRESRKN